MSFCGRRFNLYLLPVALCLLASGCALWHHKEKQVAVLRIHVENESSAAGSNKAISVLRSEPVTLNIFTDPILTEADVIGARVLDTPGGFALEVKFEDIAGWKLEQYSASNPGKHLAIFAQWSDKVADGRWLAAPLMVRRIADSKLVFTPDASREEMEKLVKGLNLAAKKNADQKSKQ
jgi:hypothetical protein